MGHTIKTAGPLLFCLMAGFHAAPWIAPLSQAQPKPVGKITEEDIRRMKAAHEKRRRKDRARRWVFQKQENALHWRQFCEWYFIPCAPKANASLR